MPVIHWPEIIIAVIWIAVIVFLVRVVIVNAIRSLRRTSRPDS